MSTKEKLLERFNRENYSIKLHKPHPGKIVGKKTLKYIKQTITELDLWED